MFEKSKRIEELEAENAMLRKSIEACNAHWRVAEREARKGRWTTELALKDALRGLFPLIEDLDQLIEVALSSVDRGGRQLFEVACRVLGASERNVFEAFPYEYHQGLFASMPKGEMLGYLESAVLGTKVADRLVSFRVQNVYELDAESPEYLDYRAELERRYRRALAGYDWMIEDDAGEADEAA